MSTFKENLQKRFEEHQVHTTIKDVLNKAQEDLKVNKGSEEAEFTLERLIASVLLAETSLKQEDVLLFPINVLDSLNKALIQLRSIMDQVRAKQANFQQLAQSIDNLLTIIHQFFRDTKTPKGIKAAISTAAEMINNLTKKNEDLLKATEEKSKEFDKQVKALQAQITNESNKLAKIAEEQSGTFLKNENDRMTKHTQKMGEWEKEHNEKVKTWGAISAAEIKMWADKHEKLLNDSSAESQESLSLIAKNLEKAKELVGIIANTGMSGNYVKIAKREWWSGLIMRVLAVLSFGAMVYFIIDLARDLPDLAKILSLATAEARSETHSIGWEIVIFRLFFSFSFLVPGFYCSRESTKHFNAERKYRNLALEFSALDPYLGLLEEKDRKEILVKKADEYFGQKCSSDPSEEMSLTKDMSLEKLLKHLERLLKAMRPKE